MSSESASNAGDDFDDPRDRFLEHYRRPRNRQVLSDADAVGFVESAGGSSLTVYMRLDHEDTDGIRIKEITFQSQRCGIAVAYASLLTELVAGQTVAQAGAIGPEDLVNRFGKGASALESAALAIGGLRRALESLGPGPPQKDGSPQD